MEYGIFTVGDVTTDPTNGRTPTEHERIKNTVTLALKAEEIGLEVFATGEHHNPPFAAPANPPVLLAHLAAKTERITLSTSTTLITTNDPVRIAEDYAYLQHLADGRMDLMLGRGNTGPVYPWFGKDIRDGISLAVENYALLHRLWREQDADREFRPYFDEAPVYGHGPSLEEYTASTPLSVGSPEQVIEKTLGFRAYAGDYRRQLFLVDHSGLPLDTVLRQLDMLGEVVAELRKHDPAPAVEPVGTSDPTLEGS